MTANITTIILRQHGLVECGPCTCKDYVTETILSVEDFKSRYSIEDMDHNFDFICSDVVDAATGHILSEKEVKKLLKRDLGNASMDIYYSREVDIIMENHGNDIHAIMHWFNDNEAYPYDEWGVEVTLTDIKMMSEKDIEETIKEKLLEMVEVEFNADELYFKWS